MDTAFDSMSEADRIEAAVNEEIELSGNNALLHLLLEHSSIHLELCYQLPAKHIYYDRCPFYNPDPREHLS